jgi:hypothetical protein
MHAQCLWTKRSKMWSCLGAWYPENWFQAEWIVENKGQPLWTRDHLVATSLTDLRVFWLLWPWIWDYWWPNHWTMDSEVVGSSNGAPASTQVVSAHALWWSTIQCTTELEKYPLLKLLFISSENKMSWQFFHARNLMCYLFHRFWNCLKLYSSDVQTLLWNILSCFQIWELSRRCAF